MRDIFTNATYVHRVAVCTLGNGRRVTTIGVLIKNHDTGCLAQQFAALPGRQLVPRFNMQSLGMPEEYWHPNCRRIHLYRCITHYFLSLPHHFHFFLGVAVILKNVDVRQDIESNLLRVNLTFNIFCIQQVGCLFGKLFNSLLTRPGDRLIGADVDALDTNSIIDRLQRHQHLDSGTVGVGDDAVFLIVGNFFRIDLGHHQRNLVVVAVLGGVVDHHTSGSRRLGCVFPGYRSPGRKQADLCF